MSDNRIRVYCTGGTFDKVYGVRSGVRDLSFPGISSVEYMLQKVGIPYVCHYHAWGLKDSLDMNARDRLEIIRVILDVSSTGKWLVVHGTDTMLDTGRVVAQGCPRATVVLTGASIPALMKDSDAELNVGLALGALQVCPQGVHIAMHGNILRWDMCRKNATTGLFEALP